MMILLIPIADKTNFFTEAGYLYPKPLVEILGKPMIQLVIDNLTNKTNFSKIIFLVNAEYCDKFHLDNTLKLISPVPCEIIKIFGETKGALCTVLSAVDLVNFDGALVISNGDQIFNKGVSSYISSFLKSSFDAAALTIESVHPRWSYLRLNDSGEVVEASEKNPISKIAIAGLYMYKKASEFISYAFDSLESGDDIQGNFYIAPVFNQYLLNGKSIGNYPVPTESFYSFYTPQRVQEYELRVR